jgi:hypothetical protein
MKMIGSHVIPRYYLERFAKKRTRSDKTGRFWVYEKDRPPRLGAPKSEGIENGYFEVLQRDHSKVCYEEAVQRLEDDAKDVLQHCANDCFVWTKRHRKQMAIYAALLFARAGTRRKANARLWQSTVLDALEAINNAEFMSRLTSHYSEKAGQEITPEDLRQAFMRVAEKSDDPVELKRVFLESLEHSVNSISRALLQKKHWQIWHAPAGAEFITSDNPLCTFLPINNEFAPGFGFAKPGVLAALPLNPAACLIMGTLDPAEHRTVDATVVRQVNEIVAAGMTRYAYSEGKSDEIEYLVRKFGSTLVFGENAFLVPKNELSTLYDVFTEIL